MGWPNASRSPGHASNCWSVGAVSARSHWLRFSCGSSRRCAPKTRRQGRPMTRPCATNRGRRRLFAIQTGSWARSDTSWICASRPGPERPMRWPRSSYALRENEKLQSRLTLVREMTADGDAAFWSREPQRDKRLGDYETRLGNSIPILLMAAQKGGVGKSSLATGLAACFADSGERVLAVDMDYQGTMSAQMILHAGLRLGADQSRVDQLLQDQLPLHWQNAIHHVDGNLHFLPAFYTLEALERREEYRWVMDETHDDVRYRLARALLSDYVKDTYKLVIIDRHDDKPRPPA